MSVYSLISRVFLVVSLTAVPFTNAMADAKKQTPHVVRAHRHKDIEKTRFEARAYEGVMETMHRNMHAPLSGDVDVDFVRQMIPHHQAAVDMAKIQLHYGRDEKLKKFNAWVIFAQEQEIGLMNNWLIRRDNGVEVKNGHDYFRDAMTIMHHGMMINYSGDADLDYVRGMIAHHQGAVDMASILIAEGNDPDLNRLANNIYSSQTYEIAWMQRWLAKYVSK